MKTLCAAVATALPLAAAAVSVSSDGLGQALIYPYYAVQSNAGNPFNTYVSIVNTKRTGKAIRVRFREARNGRETAAFNLFLGPRDVWVGAVVPDGAGARLISPDKSCTRPAFGQVSPTGPAPQGLPFSNASFSGTQADGAGDGVERTREGFIEVLEMAELTGSALNGATGTTSGYPANCAAIDAIPAADIAPPTGGLSGTLTLINVANGQDFTAAAEALEGLSRQPYYRPIADPYPAFTAAEIDPVSIVHAKQAVYRSTWTRGIDAVNAVLMRDPQGEFTLDNTVAGATDLVVTFPTRHIAVTAAATAAPFWGKPWKPGCVRTSTYDGEPLLGDLYDRERRYAPFANHFDGGVAFWNTVCGSANVLTLTPGVSATPRRATGSQAATGSFDVLAVPFGIENGWARVGFDSTPLVSQQSSTRTDMATGQVSQGPHTYSGLPVVGLALRSLSNGFLDCGGSVCQGNYGGSYPMNYKRDIQP